MYLVPSYGLQSQACMKEEGDVHYLYHQTVSKYILY